MQSDDDSFIIIGKIRTLLLNWQKLSLILIQGKLIDDLSDNIKATLNKILISIQFIIIFSKDLIPFLATEIILGVKIAL